MAWRSFDDGRSIGTRGSENGFIICDEENDLGARISLEREGSSAPNSITCGIYGWMMHTRFFGSPDEAQPQFEKMKTEIDAILKNIPLKSEASRDHVSAVSDAITKFIKQFP